MALRMARVAGRDSLALTTELLHRIRVADPTAGLWEAADMQWWWRKPRRSDTVEQIFWLDDAGPVAAVVLTDWDGKWGCDPIVLPHAGPAAAVVWHAALQLVDTLRLPHVEVIARDDDAEMIALLERASFTATDEQAGNTWMSAEQRPDVPAVPDGLRLVDRTERAAQPHHMRARNGDDVEDRLQQLSLYDPALDLTIETADGDVAAYGLFWNDTVTGVGLVEPMRTEDAYQRRGLARTVLGAGLDRLAARGARRFKVDYVTEVARHLYVSAGFRVDVTVHAYERARAGCVAGEAFTIEA